MITFEPVKIPDAQTFAEIRQQLLDIFVSLLVYAVGRLRDESFNPDHVTQSELGSVYYQSDIDWAAKLCFLLRKLRGRFPRP